MSIKIELRKAEMNDFSYKIEGVKNRKIGMHYFLENSQGNLECYELTKHTNANELAWFIKENKCFVLQEQILAAGKMIEVLT